MLQNVGQIGVEIHTATPDYKDWDLINRQRYIFKQLLLSFYDIHSKLGFKLVSYNPNGCLHTDMDDPYFMNYSYFDVLFYKAK